MLAKLRVTISWSPKLLELSRTQAQFLLSEKRSRKDGCPLSEAAFSKIKDGGKKAISPPFTVWGMFAIISLVIATLGGKRNDSGDREKLPDPGETSEPWLETMNPPSTVKNLHSG